MLGFGSCPLSCLLSSEGTYIPWLMAGLLIAALKLYISYNLCWDMFISELR